MGLATNDLTTKSCASFILNVHKLFMNSFVILGLILEINILK